MGGKAPSPSSPGPIRAPGEALIRRVCLPFDDRCAGGAGLIRLDLERSGRPIGPNDLLIAATARAHDLVLVTANTREFARVPGLRVDDWERPGRG
jgi:predicted nucleic acid-binding protein